MKIKSELVSWIKDPRTHTVLKQIGKDVLVATLVMTTSKALSISIGAIQGKFSKAN